MAGRTSGGPHVAQPRGLRSTFLKTEKCGRHEGLPRFVLKERRRMLRLYVVHFLDSGPYKLESGMRRINEPTAFWLRLSWLLRFWLCPFWVRAYRWAFVPFGRPRGS